MDPDANLKEQRELAAKIVAIFDGPNAVDDGLTCDEACRVADLAERLAELVQALDEWLSRGGFPPTGWSGPWIL